MRQLAILAALLTIAGSAPAEEPPERAVDRIRVSADGAGPSHIFWLTGDRKGDTIGIIDPLFAAIRFYRVARGNGDIGARLTTMGVCGLPVDFRPWRIHHFRNRVAIESMPDPGAAGYAVTMRALRTREFEIPRSLLRNPVRFEAAAAGVDASRWDPAQAPRCGTWRPHVGPIGAGAPERATRMDGQTILLGNAPGALAPAPAVRVHSLTNRLVSAHELEPAPGYRIVQASEGVPSDDGVLRLRTRVLVYARGTLRRALALRDTALRGKLGQKPLVILPSGELLAMGKRPGDASPFKILSCGKITAAPTGSFCEDDSAPPRPAALARMPVALPHASVAKPLSARTIFANVARLASWRLSVDTRGMPDACRSAEGCRVGGDTLNFVPIRGIRLTRGIFTRRGVPYAQARVPEDLDALLHSTPTQLSNALAGVMHGTRGWPGNLRDGLTGDLGIDCSGLVQIAWGGRAAKRLDTENLQALATPLGCSSRLPGPEYLRPGDAIGLRIDTPVKLANHVALFAAAMQLDGASDSWLVLESSSACDGVCWSVYDPAWFNGWGLYRAAGRPDASCVAKTDAQATPIPFDLTRWSRLVAGR